MEVLRDLFFDLCFLLLSFAIRSGIIWVSTRHLLFSFGQIVLWLQICHPRMISQD
jgi:hypothetical protein